MIDNLNPSSADVHIQSTFNGSPSGGAAPPSGGPAGTPAMGQSAAGGSVWSTVGKVAPWLIAGAGSIAGAIIGGRYGAKTDAANRKFNADEAQKSRDFSAEQRRTAWQDTVNDLRAAGINPMAMFYKGGSASPTPGGASASYSGGNQMQGAIAGSQVATQLASAKLMNAQAAKVEAEIPSIAQGIEESKARVNQLTLALDKMDSEILNIKADTQVKYKVRQEIQERIYQISQLTEKLTAETSSAQSAAAVNKKIAEFQTALGGDIERWRKALGVSGDGLLKFIPDMFKAVKPFPARR